MKVLNAIMKRLDGLISDMESLNSRVDSIVQKLSTEKSDGFAISSSASFPAFDVACAFSDVVAPHEESSPLDCCCGNVPAVSRVPAQSVASVVLCRLAALPLLVVTSHQSFQLVLKGTICRACAIFDSPASSIYLVSPEQPLPPPEPPPAISRCFTLLQHQRHPSHYHAYRCDFSYLLSLSVLISLGASHLLSWRASNPSSVVPCWPARICLF